MGQPIGADRLHDGGIAEEDALRARFYAILAHVLGAPPSAETLNAFGALEGDETDMGQALGTLAAVAAKTTVDAAGKEFDALFVGAGQGGELFPYKSYYLTGFLYEKPLAELRGDMARLGIENSGEVREPEDHIAAVLEMMHGLITGAFGEAADLETQREFFSDHIATWAPRFFEDLEAAKSSLLYVPVGTVGRVFMEIESEAFAMAA
ncbi:MAG: molecular chaperone TorD family protein [Rhodospirillales bacterium]|jgi:TorA maturation chaperone TorD|nr:molecular chaperone TorD family protein [Rhodospirillales bacterium]